MASTLKDGDGDPGESSRVESPVAVYRVSGPPALLEPVDHWLDALKQLGFKASASAGSAFKQVRDALQEGVPRSAFDQLRTDLGVSNEELAAIVGIPTRTLARRTERFKPIESERLLRIGSAWAKALSVLEDPAAARRWMTQPKRALGDLTPLHCCDTEIGAREVEALLGRIEHGVFS
jgi:putative toxin-antitoxin system antitoxin component (TIGR02293 family)